MNRTIRVLVWGLVCFVGLAPAGGSQGYVGMREQDVNDSIASQSGPQTHEAAFGEGVIRTSLAEKGGLLGGETILRMAGKKAADSKLVKEVIAAHANEGAVQDQIHIPEDKAKQIKAVRAAEADSLEEERRKVRLYGGEWRASFGNATLRPGTLRLWWPWPDTLEYSGIEWKPGIHLGLGISGPVASLGQYGRSFVVENGVLLGCENMRSSACTVLRTAKPHYGPETVQKVQLAENAFGMKRVVCDYQAGFGYRIVVKSVALEPYCGFSLVNWGFAFLSGSEMHNTTTMGFRLGFVGPPVLGGKIYIGDFFLQIQSSAFYFRPLIDFWVFMIDTDTSRRGSLSPGKASNLSISVGTLW